MAALTATIARSDAMIGRATSIVHGAAGARNRPI
jgi:hypothetical protein